jgi:hypothetical protein
MSLLIQGKSWVAVPSTAMTRGCKHGHDAGTSTVAVPCFLHRQPDAGAQAAERAFFQYDFAAMRTNDVAGDRQP